MMNALGDAVSTDQFVVIFLCILLIAYFCYKEWPEFKKRMSASSIEKKKDETEDAEMSKRMANIEDDVRTIKSQLNRDYQRINEIERKTEYQQQRIEESLEERQIIMQGLLASLQGLQELGANGPTKKAAAVIQDYMNRMAHNK